MRKVQFYKYHGTGNDFIMIDNRIQKPVPDDAGMVKTLCDRRFGIGADGLILLEESETLDFKMKYYNADGNEGSMCGNGGRCIVAFANFLGLTGASSRFEAIDGVHEAVIRESTGFNHIVSLHMGDVKDVEISNGMYIMNTGSPHYVTFCADTNTIDVVAEGRKIRYNDKYRDSGINVNFVASNNGEFSMRTYERGVEDETWSCGTGTVAAAIAMALEGKTVEGSPVILDTKGGKLEVSFVRKTNHFSDIWLTGPAVQVYEGWIDLK